MDNLELWKSKSFFPGQKYGRYTVISTHRVIGTYLYYGLCQCECGSDRRYVGATALRNGEAQSCGCLHRERVTKHGAWGHPLFQTWSGMQSRCTNKDDKRYDRYGGRGIKICARWNDVNAFIKDMGPKFKKGLQLDRIDNDGDYTKENCRWATTGEQTRNYSRNVRLTLNGETLCIADWATKLNINYGTLWDRIKQGWSAKRALTTPTLSHVESNRLALKSRWSKR